MGKSGIESGCLGEDTGLTGKRSVSSSPADTGFGNRAERNGKYGDN